MPGQAFSNVDNAWLRMEQPDNLMMISGVMVFGAPMAYARLKALIEKDLLRYDRFRQRAVMSRTGRAHWEDDPRFDMDYHLKRIQLAPPGDQAALQDVTSELASTQLDFSRPLWQFHLVENYGEGSALIARLHHCIADGVALVQVLLSLTSPDPDSPPWIEYADLPKPASAQRRKGPFPVTRSAIRTTQRVAQVLAQEGMRSLVDWDHGAARARTGIEGARALVVLVGRWPDPKTIFKGPLGVPKRTAWSPALPLREVKAVGRALGGTVNDVLLSAVAGAMRRYLEARGQPVDGLNCRAVVPVNMRAPGSEAQLGNKFSLFFLSLPLGIADPVERLHELKRRMDGLKGSLEAPVAFGILNAIGMSPEGIQDIVVNIFGSKGTGVMTNVVGPKVQIYLAGAPLDGLMFWVPQSGRLGLGVSIMSYNDKVWLGVITDQGLVPDPESLVEAYEVEVQALLNAAKKVKTQPSAKQLGEMLDNALQAVDALAQPVVPPHPAPARCQALTKEGKPCKNPAVPGSACCRVHEGTGAT